MAIGQAEFAFIDVIAALYAISGVSCIAGAVVHLPILFGAFEAEGVLVASRTRRVHNAVLKAVLDGGWMADALVGADQILAIRLSRARVFDLRAFVEIHAGELAVFHNRLESSGANALIPTIGVVAVAELGARVLSRAAF